MDGKKQGKKKIVKWRMSDNLRVREKKILI